MSVLPKQRLWQKKNWEDIINKKVFTISPLLAFADTLAAELLKQNTGTPEALAKTVIFLPTRRACKTVTEAFLRQSEGRPLLLPRLIPFGEIDDGETDASLALLDEEGDIPPAMPSLRRRLLLTRLIRQNPKASGLGELSIEKALHLADALSAFLDQAYIEQMPFDRLTKLVPEEFASHWQEILTFLETVTFYWPLILKEQGYIDPADRQVRVFKAQCKLWKKNPPDFPVIAAGSTGSQPATAELLDTIASLPTGCVILPGIDLIADEESFSFLEPSHPQYNMIHLIKKMGITRTDIKPFGTAGITRPAERLRLISEAMRPAETSEAWRTIKPFTPEALEGITRLDCSSVQEEALAIALILRQVLETPGKTAALVTPDRTLARRVIAEMNRWGVTLDDSAGTTLPHTPLGAFLNLLAEMAFSHLKPFELLACLKHPLAAGGIGMGTFRTLVRRLELHCLHGSRPGDGFAGLEQAVREKDDLKTFVHSLKEQTGSFVTLMQSREPVDMNRLTDAHLQAAEALACSADRTGADRLWQGDAGEAAVDFLNKLKQEGGIIGPIYPAEYVSLFKTLMSGISVRPKYGMHPRIDILGAIEARLIQPDVLILGGLNEGTWPQAAAADPWLSRPMRQECGLPAPERRTGLSAHDFAQAFCAPDVFITRAMKDGGTPTVPSRWLLRLDAVLSASGLQWNRRHWLEWVRQLDMPEKMNSLIPPTPTPPVSARPRRLSVTQVETWMRDPYSIYARHILGLKPLNEIDEALNIADFGNLVHKILEKFCTLYPASLPPEALQKITAIGSTLMNDMNFSVKAKAFWKPRLERTLSWFIEQQAGRMETIRHIFCEQKASVILPAAAGDFELFGFADRIDVLKDGSVNLIDYKTGTIPSENSVKNGYSPQLPLEAGLLLQGGFENIKTDKINAMEYWRLRGKEDGGFVKTLKDDPLELTEASFKRLKDLIDAYDKPETPYLPSPDMSISLQYRDYDHLARLAEWVSVDSDKEEDG